MSGEVTKPHDYRVLLEKCPDMTIVGGQAVTAWAITYLDAERTQPVGFGSKDLDVMAKMTVDEIIAALPGWEPKRTPLWSFLDVRRLKLLAVNSEGRLLVVEVLSKVRGLTKEDLEAVVDLVEDGVSYHLLDPIAVLKAKAANVREIDQAGPPPRQDRPHLQMISQCVSPFLRDAHQQALADPSLQADFAKTISRTFKTLSDRHTLRTLLTESIQPLTLVPAELKDSPIEKVRTAFEHQMPRLEKSISDAQGFVAEKLSSDD